MAWIFTADLAAPSDEVSYGWAHLHQFHRLLAAEEGIDLATMQNFGGTRPWSAKSSPLRLLFDLDLDHVRSEYGPLAERLREIHSRWSATGLPDDGASARMINDQIVSLGKLVSLVDACSAQGGHLRVDSA